VDTVIARSASLAIIVATLVLFGISINSHITRTSVLGALCIVISLSFYCAAVFKHLSFNLPKSRNSRQGQESPADSPRIFNSDAHELAENADIRRWHFGGIENSRGGVSGNFGLEQAHTTVRRVRSETNDYVH